MSAKEQKKPLNLEDLIKDVPKKDLENLAESMAESLRAKDKNDIMPGLARTLLAINIEPRDMLVIGMYAACTLAPLEDKSKVVAVLYSQYMEVMACYIKSLTKDQRKDFLEIMDAYEKMNKAGLLHVFQKESEKAADKKMKIKKEVKSAKSINKKSPAATGRRKVK
jgi:hypothetical protein